MTQTVTIRQVNQQTSAIFARFGDGEDLIVTKTGRPLARIIPFKPRDELERLAAEGRLIPAENPDAGLIEAHDINLDVDALLAADRAERELL